MKFIFFLFITLTLTSCVKYNQKHIVNDLSKSQKIILQSNKSANVYSLTLNVTGNIKGYAEITLMLDGEPYKSEKIKDKVNFNWAGDWYSDKATIIYTTKNATDGKLVFKYKFNTI